MSKKKQAGLRKIDLARRRETWAVINRSAHLRRKKLTGLAAEAQGGLCIYCRQPFSPERPATFEHIVPKSMGGLDLESNCAASCRPCNQERKAKNHGAFLRYKQRQMGF